MTARHALLDEAASWRAGDFFQYAMYAAVAYIHAAASRCTGWASGLRHVGWRVALTPAQEPKT